MLEQLFVELQEYLSEIINITKVLWLMLMTIAVFKKLKKQSRPCFLHKYYFFVAIITLAGIITHTFLMPTKPVLDFNEMFLAVIFFLIAVTFGFIDLAIKRKRVKMGLDNKYTIARIF